MKALIRIVFVAAVALGLSATLNARPWWLRGADTNENDFLPPDVAFQVGSRIDGNLIRVRWVIADGYYLYRKRMEVIAESPDLMLSKPSFPQGKMKTDPYLGTQEIFTQQVEGTVVFARSDFGAHPLQIKVTYQGCAEAGLCYPPITKVLLPGSGVPLPQARPHLWEGAAILGGALAFLLAGLLLRKGRRLDDTPLS
jgi:thiol:disulfide interchange protein DsbD